MAELEATVDQTVRVAAAMEVVFQYFVDPEKLASWMCSSAELDPRPGGVFHVDMNGFDVAAGEFVVVEPPRRVVFTWGWERGGAPIPPGASTVEVTLTPDGEDTLVHLVHRDLPAPMTESHAAGWSEHFETLVALAAAGRLSAG